MEIENIKTNRELVAEYFCTFKDLKESTAKLSEIQEKEQVLHDMIVADKSLFALIQTGVRKASYLDEVLRYKDGEFIVESLKSLDCEEFNPLIGAGDEVDNDGD